MLCAESKPEPVMSGTDIRQLHRGEFLELVRDRHWEFVRRCRASGSVHVLALTPADEIVLVEQTRLPVGGKTIELSAGVIGDEVEHAAEGALDCARRELIEETGYRAESVELLQVSPTAPGLTAEIQHLVRATGLRRVGEGGGVGREDISVHVVPLAEVHGFLAKRAADGLLIDHRIHAALYWQLVPGAGD